MAISSDRTVVLAASGAGAIGLGELAYGGRQTKPVPMIAGVWLCIYPYFAQSALW